MCLLKTSDLVAVVLSAYFQAINALGAFFCARPLTFVGVDSTALKTCDVA
ncbi:hypothetical protein B0H14DRAFT_3505282 [Mycena olivaceomarginata]|nr:hypothetical protein B0H14DRAFT_3505282 [Mycena olivaceomarginata]